MNIIRDIRDNINFRLSRFIEHPVLYTYYTQSLSRYNIALHEGLDRLKSVNRTDVSYTTGIRY